MSSCVCFVVILEVMNFILTVTLHFEVRRMIKGDCPYGFTDFDDWKEECAFHPHDLTIERIDNKRRNN